MSVSSTAEHIYTASGYGNAMQPAMRTELAERIAGEVALSVKPGSTLRKWRETFGVTKNDLAKHLKQSPSMVADLESGRRAAPSVATVRKLVNGLLALDEKRGSPMMKRYTITDQHEAIFAIREFPIGVRARTFVDHLDGEVLAGEDRLDKDLYGYTVIDSIRAITSLTAYDYLKVYGWSTERALIFTGVKHGRSPMVAIRSHPMKPGMVVYHRPEKIDELAIRLAEIEGIALVTTELAMETLLSNLKKI